MTALTTWEVSITYFFEAEDAAHALEQFENTVFEGTDPRVAETVLAHVNVCEPVEEDE